MLATRCIACRHSFRSPCLSTGVSAFPPRPFVRGGQRRFAWGLSDDTSKTRKTRAPWESPPVKKTRDLALESAKCGGKLQGPKDGYDWYLHKLDILDKDGTLFGHWIDSLDAEAISMGIPKLFRDDPLAIFASPGCSTTVAQSCLESFILTTHSSWRESEDLLQAYKEHRPGVKGLHWLLTNYRTGYIPRGDDLMKEIVHCLVAEGRDDLFERWRTLSRAPGGHKGRDVVRIWTKDDMFKDYVEAKAFWSQKGINAALIAFHAAPHGQSLAHAAKWIFQQLWNTDTSGVDETLFEKFERWQTDYTQDPGDRIFKSTRLKLRHPTKRDGLPALQFIREADQMANESPFVQDLINPRDGRAASILFYYLVRAAQVLHGQGLVNESHEVLDLGAATIPLYFKRNKRNPYGTLNAQVAMRYGLKQVKRDTEAGS